MRPLLWLPAFEQIGKGLHHACDEILDEPLPEHWVDLIDRLNAEEALRTNRGATRGKLRIGCIGRE